jgi:hypothetical protein
VLIDRFHALDELEIHARYRANGGIEDPLDSLDDVLGVELATVMPLNALAQIERPGFEVLAPRPVLGEVRLKLSVVLQFS